MSEIINVGTIPPPLETFASSVDDSRVNAEPTLPIRSSGSYRDSADPVDGIYAVGVFLSFTLSQAGMVRHHQRLGTSAAADTRDA